LIKYRVLIALLVLLVGACSSSELSPTLPAPTDTVVPAASPVPPEPTDTAAPTASPEPTLAPPMDVLLPTAEPVATDAEPAAVPLPELAGLPLPTGRGELFANSGVCASCHTNMVDESGADVSIDTFWRSTMMANAARDPYWRAAVRGEVLSNPDYEAIIEDKCATCHMPMTRFTRATKGEQGKVFDDFVPYGDSDDPEGDLHALAIDGIACTLCHQIKETDLGQPSNFSGGYVIDTDLPQGERLNFGPFPVGRAQANLMQMSSGFVPVESQHVRQRDFCATCHMLYTPYVDAQGEIAGEFPEQMSYLEWVYSGYRDEQTCQDCHMPHAQGGVTLSMTGGKLRSPFARHVFVGGNTFIHRVFQQFGDEMAVTASSANFEATIERVLDQLQNRSAAIALEKVALSDSLLTAEVTIESQAGHKFPTGFPSRRAWLHLSIRDAGGQVVFESGAVGGDGLIADNDNDADPAVYEPHYEVINAPGQVQIYEAIMGNTEGEVTTTLLRAALYLKDNRLLPQGFDKSVFNEDVAVRGGAMADADFVGGGDRVQYAVDLGAAEGPFTVEVELLYQTIGYRWADNLRRYEAPEIEDFIRYYEAVPNLPVVVASATVEVE